MQKLHGSNQSMVRRINQRLVLDLLVKGSRSCTDLAKELKLSNTAVSKIVAELKEQGVVTVDEAEPVGGELGRKPILFKLNGAFGMVAVVDVCENSVLLADMTGQKLASRNLGETAVYNERMLVSLADALSELCAENASRKLLAICAVTSGVLDPVTGEYIFANRFENYKGINLMALFKARFGVPVTVMNDTRVAMVAEQNYGVLARASNAVLLHIDTGIAAALMINGASYTGDKGFAGEEGLITESGGSTLESRASLAAVCAKVTEAVERGTCSLALPVTVESVIEAFAAGDDAVCGIVLESAESVAVAARNLIHLLDCRVVLTGRVKGFGERYLAVIERHIREFDYLTSKVQFSALSHAESSERGGIKVAVELGMDTVLRPEQAG